MKRDLTAYSGEKFALRYLDFLNRRYGHQDIISPESVVRPFYVAGFREYRNPGGRTGVSSFDYRGKDIVWSKRGDKIHQGHELLVVSPEKREDADNMMVLYREAQKRGVYDPLSFLRLGRNEQERFFMFGLTPHLWIPDRSVREKKKFRKGMERIHDALLEIVPERRFLCWSDLGASVNFGYRDRKLYYHDIELIHPENRKEFFDYWSKRVHKFR
ncbi:MAG: hypothetical protein JW716_05315 [Candidatus Aenigmarchaeota archaeon]|nr:hypothetical protein [Candidatus Aenigmarchaeota archaeon]